MSRVWPPGNLELRRDAARRGWVARRERLDAAFWDRVDVRGSEECWPWLGVRQTRKGGAFGYGVTTRNHKRVFAHRRALELHLGHAIPEGMNALHSCDNPPCCNPAHLRIGTQLENMRDMSDRTAVRGEAHPQSKLTNEKIIRVRRLIAEGETKASVARMFGVCDRTIRDIAEGRTWTHLS